MCGRFTFTASAQSVQHLFPLFDLAELELQPRYNVAPSQPVLAVRAGADGKPQLTRLRWGLVPFWADDPSIGNRLINARAETAAEKPAFRAAFRQRRCLVLADGFYEWQKAAGKRQPYYFRLKGGGPFAFAGLWENWDKGDAPLETCTILTTGANELVRPVHDRMPLILPQESFERWLDPSRKVAPELQELLHPLAAEAMTGYPVTPLVNNPRNEDPRCISPQA
jgi:putative SOS response-associated peptidase YedK